ncbi:MAG: tetratricopeptide repeat protein, partial [Anaerolineae bacterium]|nr:tetratricopeptide repeat protein [Anaerolineae bacterium]
GINRMLRPYSTSPHHPRPSAALHNLPTQLTRFIGREQEKAEVSRLQATTRLLTLTGPGGSGKTRLALEVATELYAAQDYSDGVWLVELAPLSEPALVPQAVASALGVREIPGQLLTETLVTYLQSKQLLLVLDNCEHLIEACATLADTLLRACPSIRILATSREPLHIPGELTWQVPPLSLPDSQQLPPLDELLQYEAVQLIIDRATAILPTFTVTQYNAPSIAQVCQQLDGLPLAIELAAARVKVLTVAQIAARLQNSFRLLVGGNRLALTRQQTLEATLDWSYELLSEPERALFRRLAVFAGGFTLEAAEGICAGEGLDPAEILDVLSQLVDKSLVVVREEGQERRYRLLETVRQYGAEKLRASGEDTRMRTQHQAWYLALAVEADPELYGPRQAEWLDRLETEHDNLRAVLAWSKTPQSEPWLGLRLARALFWFWYQRRYLSEGRSEFESALAQTEMGQRTWVRAMALYGSGAMAMYQGDLTTARPHLTESITIWRELGNDVELAMALLTLGTVAINQGDERAAGPLLEACLPLFKKLGQETRYAVTLTHLGDVGLVQGDWTSARTRYEESLALQRAMGHQWGTAQALNNLGEVARCEGDYSRAVPLYEESLALFRELGSSGDVARSLHNLGYMALAQDDIDQAATRFAESLALFQERGSKRGLVECLAGFAGVATIRADFRRAAQLLGAVEAHFEAMEAAMWPADRLEYERSVAAVQTALGEEDFAAAWAEGRKMTVEKAIELIQISH